MENTSKIADELLKFTGAKSVFLYGSRARSDFYEESDYEIGILMERNKYIGRSEIKKKFNLKGINIFPFYYEDFIAGNPDTPFVKSIYMKEIIGAGKTLAGEKIAETLKPSKITLLDIIQDVRFNLGYALAATHSYRNKDNKTASLHFSKSCLFGTRDYIIFAMRKFPFTYDEIVNELKDINLDEFQELPLYAYNLRKRKAEINEQDLFKNISYLNKFVENRLLEVYSQQGNLTLID